MVGDELRQLHHPGTDPAAHRGCADPTAHGATERGLARLLLHPGRSQVTAMCVSPQVVLASALLTLLVWLWQAADLDGVTFAITRPLNL